MFFLCLSLFKVKIQKHTTFEAVVHAHAYMMESIEEEGKAMIEDAHYASDFVQVKIDFIKI